MNEHTIETYDTCPICGIVLEDGEYVSIPLGWDRESNKPAHTFWCNSCAESFDNEQETKCRE